MESQRVAFLNRGTDRRAAVRFNPMHSARERTMAPTPAFLAWKIPGRSLVGCSPGGRTGVGHD